MLNIVDGVSNFMFFFQAENGIRYLVRSRGLGDVYKRQVVDQPHRQLTRGDADRLVDVAEDDVVDPRPTLDHPRLATAQVVAGGGLQFERDVLGDVAEQGPVLEPVSYTHLTLPTNYSVQISVVAVSFKKIKTHIYVLLPLPYHHVLPSFHLDHILPCQHHYIYVEHDL